MKPTVFDRPKSQAGSVLLVVLIMLVITAGALVGMMSWTQTSMRLTARHNQYLRTVAAAEAATEKVLAYLARDFRAGGEALVMANLSSYRTLVPTTAESPLWADYEFCDPAGVPNRVQVEFVPPAEFRVLSSTYRGLYGYATAFRIIAQARERSGLFRVPAAVRQELEVATIPVFQFAVFYNTDLEINPGPDMTITGPVHCNTNIFLQPNNTLIFNSDVTASSQIILDKKPGDPLTRQKGTVIFRAEHDSGVSTLTLPIGTNNTPAAVREVVEIPPPDESPLSDMGRQRYYNKAHLIILVSNQTVRVTSGLTNNFATTIPWQQATQFLSTNVTFFNQREQKTIRATQIDVGKLKRWIETNTLLGSRVSVVYVADLRTQSSSTESGVRLVNGQTLPSGGLTVATPNPIYIQGHYNAPSAHLGTTNTSLTKPASIIADAVTILSTAWNDANSAKPLSARTAANTTVNAALLAGIVPTTDGSYSGGLENFPRFLENWSGKTFTYNGSMVVLYESRYATGPWRGTGSTIGIYNPPIRQWAFDQNFRDPAKLPPGCPSVRALIRGRWEMVAATTTSWPEL